MNPQRSKAKTSIQFAMGGTTGRNVKSVSQMDEDNMTEIERKKETCLMSHDVQKVL